jgi:membrane peptidoglycan carboxypeptidase
VIKPYLKAIGLRSLQDGVSYGYPLSIGAGEIQMLELANAYMHLSAAGKPAEINPISEIRTTNGSIIYQKEVKKQRQVIPSGVASLIWSMLSTPSNMPGGWVSNFSLRGFRNYAIKT